MKLSTNLKIECVCITQTGIINTKTKKMIIVKMICHASFRGKQTLWLDLSHGLKTFSSRPTVFLHDNSPIPGKLTKKWKNIKMDLQLR